jgi:ATP-dependent DNA helicase PIF1
LSRIPSSFIYQKPTALFALKKEVEIVNRRELDNLPGQETVYPALDFFSNGNSVTEAIKKKMDDSLLADGELKLKVGAQVMIIKNLPNSNLFNGQVGKVVKLETDKVYIEIGFKASKKIVLLQREEFILSSNDSSRSSIRKQFPLVLSYAMSIHKAQGQTIRYLLVDFKSIFETGQAYVALSRCVSLENLQVLNFAMDKVKVNPKIVEFHKKLKLI